MVSESTRIATASARMVSLRPGQSTPLYVYGPTGCGKTHLLEGIRQAAGQQLRRVVLVSAEQFTSGFLEALQGSGLPSFRRKYRAVELLIIDDVQFFAGKRATLVELLHTIDALLRDGRQLVFAADRPPGELTGVGPELVARFTGGLVCGMGLPDALAREQILMQQFARHDVRPPGAVVEMLAASLSGDARQLQGAVHRLVATSEALGRPITLELAETALADIFRATCRMVRLTDIEAAVCDVFGLEPKSLQSGRRTQNVSQPRMLAMWLARKHTRAAFAEIGDYFGGRAHSTVISASRKVGRLMRDRSRVRLAHGECDIEDAVRRIESRLRA